MGDLRQVAKLLHMIAGWVFVTMQFIIVIIYFA